MLFPSIMGDEYIRQSTGARNVFLLSTYLSNRDTFVFIPNTVFLRTLCDQLLVCDILTNRNRNYMTQGCIAGKRLICSPVVMHCIYLHAKFIAQPR